MIPGGYGFEVLHFPRDGLRDIAQLPDDVSIVAALPVPRTGWQADLPPGWTHDVPLRRDAWHRDADGTVRESVWHEAAGWVPLYTP